MNIFIAAPGWIDTTANIIQIAKKIFFFLSSGRAWETERKRNRTVSNDRWMSSWKANLTAQAIPRPRKSKMSCWRNSTWWHESSIGERKYKKINPCKFNEPHSRKWPWMIWDWGFCSIYSFSFFHWFLCSVFSMLMWALLYIATINNSNKVPPCSLYLWIIPKNCIMCIFYVWNCTDSNIFAEWRLPWNFIFCKILQLYLLAIILSIYF